MRSKLTVAVLFVLISVCFMVSKSFADVPAITPYTLTSLSSNNTSTSIKLDWTDTNEDQFKVWRAPATDGAYTPLTTLSANTITYTNAGLDPNTNYAYKIVASKEGYSDLSSNIILMRTYIGTTQNLKVQTISESQLKITWDLPAGITTGDVFEVERSSDGINFTFRSTMVDATGTSYSDNDKGSGLIEGLKYYYKVRAKNDAGYTPYSDVATGTPQKLTNTASVGNTTGGTITINPETGEIKVDVPSDAFTGTVSLTVSTSSVPSSNDSTIKVTGIGISITKSSDDQPNKVITIKVNYRDSDLPAGFDETKLVIARYDAENKRWIPLPSTVDTVANIVTATTDHLSTFALVQLAPAADIAGVKAYPNPLNSKLNSITIANLTANADIKIYSVAGELVRTVGYTTGNGQAIWDGRNDSGSLVASGVYIIYIKSDSGTKKIKVAVEK